MTNNKLFQIERTSMLNGINKVGKALKKVGIKPFKLDADKIIYKAIKKADYKEALPQQVEIGLRRLINSINSESEPNTFGSLAVKTLFERTLYQRLKIEQHLKKHPEIEELEIKEPVFIIGMPRTGTSILHALMHEDPNHRSPLAWECLLPYPLATPENFTNNEQLNTVREEFEKLFKLVPDFQKKHHMAPDSPQECLGITAFDFNSFQTTAQLFNPSYMEWFFNDADRLSTMRYHKRFLQYLQSSGVKAERWLLKSPVHLMRLNEIFEVYPDARIIMTHRTPDKVVPSAASLITSVRSLYSDTENPLRTGLEQAETWSEYFNRFLDSRQSLDKESQIIDLKFEDFVSDQMSTVKKIYERFNWELSDTAVKKMEHFLALHPKDKHGIHHYSLKDFGLKEDLIQQKYSKYIEFIEQL